MPQCERQHVGGVGYRDDVVAELAQRGFKFGNGLRDAIPNEDLLARKIVRGDVAERARDLLRQICVAREVTIIRGAVSPDHIHMLVAAPPQLSPSKLVQFLKGRSSRLLQREFPALRKRYWGQHLWARGTTARASARWTNKRSASISRTKDGTRMLKDSRSPRRPSLKPAREPGSLQAASAATRLSVGKESTAFRR